MKRPSFQFYPGDWLRSTDLRSCSLAAKGLWAEMLCLMHEGTPYGHLKVKDKVILPPNLARMVGATLGEIEGLLRELEDSGVFSRDEEGCIFSRRMIRDEKIRNSRAEGGKRGGNPALMVNRKVNLVDNREKTFEITPATASASASATSSLDLPSDKLIKNVGSLNKKTKAKKEKILSEDFSEGFLRFWNCYPEQKAKTKSWEIWQKMNCESMVDELVEHVNLMIAEDDNWAKGFIPNPTTYLNQKRWTDRPSQKKRLSPNSVTQNNRAVVDQFEQEARRARESFSAIAAPDKPANFFIEEIVSGK